MVDVAACNFAALKNARIAGAEFFNTPIRRSQSRYCQNQRFRLRRSLLMRAVNDARRCGISPFGRHIESTLERIEPVALTFTPDTSTTMRMVWYRMTATAANEIHANAPLQ